MNDLITELRSHGLEIKPELNVGIIRNGNEWFVGSSFSINGHEAIFATFGDWSKNSQIKYRSDLNGSAADPEVMAKIEREMKAQAAARKKAKLAFQESQAIKLHDEWRTFNTVGRSAYLEKKGIGEELFGARIDIHGNLIVPMVDIDGRFWNFQRIFGELPADGVGKKMQWGARVEELFHTLHGPQGPGTFQANSGEEIFICEGFATAASIALATRDRSCAVVCAFAASNLESVAKAWRERSPDARITICADNDAYTVVNGAPKNVGINSAAQASASITLARVVAPTFKHPRKGLTDWNDLHAEEGLGAVSSQIFELHGSGDQAQDDSSSQVGPDSEPAPGMKETPKSGPFSENLIKYPTKTAGFYKTTTENGKIKSFPDFDGLAFYLQNEFGLKSSPSFAYIFDETHYRVISLMELKNKIDQLTNGFRGPGIVSEFYQAVSYKTFCPDGDFLEPDGFINLANGVLDVNMGKLLPRDKTWFFRYVLPHDYDPTAKCPNWFKFLDFVFEGNQELSDLSAEIFGYVLSGGKPWLHKAFFLDGSGRNGKSTWLEALKLLIGKDNYSSVPMCNLGKPFSVVMADGKLANIVGELEGKDLSSELFKIAVGGEELTAAHKNKPEYKMEFLAKMVFAMNNPPQFKDSSAGNYEKLCILPFKRYIEEKDRDASVINRIRPEMSGILNWALAGLERLRERGRLPSVDSVRETLVEYRTANDAVFQWCEEFVRIGDAAGENSYVIGAFYPHYREWCKSEGRFSVSKNWFCRSLTRELKARIPNVRITKPTNKTKCTGRFAVTAKYELSGEFSH